MRFPRFLFILLSVAAARAEDVSVSASLTRQNAAVGEPVQLQIKLNGSSNSGQPPSVAVDGLDIRYLGPSTQMQMENFTHIRRSVTYIYQVVPVRAGTFTIPAVLVEVDGKRLKTAPLTLSVESGAGGGSQQPLDKVGFAEIVLPKKTAYVGEAIPIDLRLNVDDRVHWQLETMPQFEGEGFTKTKLTQPRQESARRDGREYNVVAVHTAITPSKAGKLSIGPLDFTYIAQVPRARRKQGGSIFDMFDNVFNDPTFGANQRMNAKAAAVEIDVKLLPAEGRPKDFSGGVGDFKFTAEGSPHEVKVGDPVTMKLRISGRGSFDRVEAPAMTDPTGWRTYPATGVFKAEDEIGIAGAKTFEVAVIAEARKTAMPDFAFSYFDPASEKYVTLRSEPRPLTVTGAPAPPPAITANAPQEKKAAPTDILGLHYEFGAAHSSFEPLYARREFLLAQLVPLGVVLTLIGRRVLRRSESARAADGLRREKAALLRGLRAESSHAKLFDAAARVIQIDTALGSDRAADSVDAATACQSRRLDPQTAESVAAIFSARAELLYAGGGSGDGRVSAAERNRVIETIAKFSSANGNA